MRHANLPVFVPHIGCPNRCSFCNQQSISGQSYAPSAEDVRKICQEFMQQNKQLQAELAFFGGSFTAIDRGYMISLLEAAQPFIELGMIDGIRISTRPDAIEGEILRILQRYGVTAIELGAQSMCDEVLQKNLRGHTADDVERASRLIRENGFRLGLQMMTGLYGDTWTRCKETAERLARLRPDTVRIYPTVVLAGTYLERLYRQDRYHPPDLEESIEICAELLEYFEGQHIRVIRMGLHASETLGNEAIAGAYHPAFRELCENRIYLKKVLALLPEQPQKIIIYVSPKALSKMAGQHRCNQQILQQRGYPAKIVPDEALKLYEVRIERR